MFGIRFLRCPTFRDGRRTARPVRQAPGQFVFQGAAGLHIQRLVDGFGAHLHLRLIGKLDLQPAGDLLRGVLLGQVRLHHATQPQIGDQLARLRPRGAVVGQCMRRRGPIAAQPIGVAAQLPRHRRRRPAEERRDGPDRVAAGSAERDLFPLRQRQTPTLQVPAPTRSDPTRRGQPTTALLAIAAGCDRGIVDELPSRHARPEHLIDLRNHPIREPHTTPPTRDVAITARTRGTLTGHFGGRVMRDVNHAPASSACQSASGSQVYITSSAFRPHTPSPETRSRRAVRLRHRRPLLKGHASGRILSLAIRTSRPSAMSSMIKCAVETGRGLAWSSW